MEKTLGILLTFVGISLVSLLTFFVLNQPQQKETINKTVIINEIDQQKNITSELENIFLSNETIDENILPSENNSNISLEINTSEIDELYKIISEDINESEIDELII